MPLVIAGSLVLLVGVPYLLVFLYDWSRGDASLIAGVASVPPAVVGAALLFAGLRAVRTAEQGLAQWRRVSGQIVSVERRPKSSSWELQVRWTQPVTGQTRELSSDLVDVHPQYLLPDGKVPVAVNPDDPDQSVVDASMLESVPDSEMPPLTRGQWLRAYAAGAAASLRHGKGFLAVFMMLLPMAFVVLGGREIIVELAKSGAVPIGGVIGTGVGLAGVALVLWLSVPRERMTGQYLLAHGVRTEAKVLGVQPGRHDTRKIVLEWPLGRARVESIDYDPVQTTFPVWRDPANSRVYWVDTRAPAKP